LAQAATAQDDLAKPVNWPSVGSQTAGIQLSLRTRWVNGSLEYSAILADRKGKVARYFSRHLDSGPIPLASFRVSFYDEQDFPIYTIYIDDRDFSKVENTTTFQAYGKRQCTEKMYRTLLSSGLALSYPTELATSGPTRNPLA
jgi:hypothetical protein